jgi:diguanylate cyclase (GGDEF)-like protein/PAS domain S-box-containing protein
MSHLRSSTRLFLLIGVLSALLLAIGSLGLYGITQSNAALKTVYQDRTVAIGLLSEIQHQLLRGRLLIDASVLDPRPQASAGNLVELGSTSAVISKTWAAYKATYLTKEEEKLAAKFEQDHLNFEQQGLAPAVAALRANDVAGVQGLIRDKILPLDANLQSGLEGLMQIQLSVAKQEYQVAVDRYDTVRLVSVAAIAGGVLFAILTGLAVLRARRQELTVALERQSHADMALQLQEKNDLVQVLEQQRQDLAASEFRWKFAIEGAGDGVWDSNLQTGEESYSPRWKAMLGYAEDEILPDHQEWESRIHPDDRQTVLARHTDYLCGTAPRYELEYRLRCKDGSYKWILSRGMIVSRDPNGKPLRTIGTHTDISERKKAEGTIRLAAKVFKHALEGIMITALDGSIIEVNDAFTTITGYSRDEVIGKNPRLLKSGRHSQEYYQQFWSQLTQQGSWIGENWNRRKNGEIYAQTQKISTARDAQGKPLQYVCLFSDITAAKNHEQELERIARYDSLTKLPNRALLGERLEQALNQTRRRGQHLAVVFIDLDGFKAVNDTHGHEAGDHLLITLAERMKGALRDGDILARLGGDEFVAVLLDLADVDASAPMLNRLLEAAARPFQFDQARLQVSASLGVTFYPQAQDQAQELEPDQLLRQADQAMYQAKQSGKNRFYVFDAEQDRSVRSHHESMESIRRALAQNELELAYQPKVNLRHGTIIGVEALIRWRHPQRGQLLPAEFLPMIEDHPLAIELGQWVIENALLQIERWRQVGLDLAVSVNIGRRHLMQADFVQRLREALAAHPRLQPSCLELELLEANAINDLDHVSRVIQECRSIGVECALDDFGSGYSSLTGLKKLPVKYLKIDEDFIRDMLDSSDSLLILIGVLKLASAFDLKVIAEGVETAQHGSMLLELGCELAQGYGIAHPMPADELPAWVKNWKPDALWSAAAWDLRG